MTLYICQIQIYSSIQTAKFLMKYSEPCLKISGRFTVHSTFQEMLKEIQGRMKNFNILKHEIPVLYIY